MDADFWAGNADLLAGCSYNEIFMTGWRGSYLWLFCAPNTTLLSVPLGSFFRGFPLNSSWLNINTDKEVRVHTHMYIYTYEELERIVQCICSCEFNFETDQ